MAGATSMVLSLLRKPQNIKDAYCLSVASAPGFVKERCVDFACNLDFVQDVSNVKFVQNSWLLCHRLKQKASNKASLCTLTVESCQKVAKKGGKLACSVDVNPASVVFHVVPSSTVINLWSQYPLQEASIKQVAEFLLYLFPDRKLQPSTIDGYRSAVADMDGPSNVAPLVIPALGPSLDISPRKIVLFVQLGCSVIILT